MSDAGSERGGPGRKPSYFENDGKVRDFGNWERKGPLSPAPGAGPPVRDGGRLRDAGPPRERRASPSWGEAPSDAGSRPPRREYERAQAPERAPTAAEQDSQWRTKMRPDASPAATPDVSSPASPAQADAPKERPRLNLAKRTVSTSAEPDSAGASDAKASPFGAARPIDTAAREREVEEKRQLAIRQKKEADDKAAEEKKAKDEAERAARAERADKGQAEQEDAKDTKEAKVTSPTAAPRGWRDGPPREPRGPPREQRGDRRASRQQNGGTKDARTNNKEGKEPKENGDAPQQPRPSFSILKAEGDEAEGDMDAPDADANGTIVADKDVKPQEPVVVAGETTESTTENLEGDGWNTVTAPKKNNRRGGGRAIAS